MVLDRGPVENILNLVLDNEQVEINLADFTGVLEVFDGVKDDHARE